MKFYCRPCAPFPLLAKIEYLDEEGRVPGYVGPDYMVTPEMNPGIAGAQRQVRLH